MPCRVSQAAVHGSARTRTCFALLARCGEKHPKVGRTCSGAQVGPAHPHAHAPHARSLARLQPLTRAPAVPLPSHENGPHQPLNLRPAPMDAPIAGFCVVAKDGGEGAANGDLGFGGVGLRGLLALLIPRGERREAGTMADGKEE
ncbi:uncharacterized protein K452DRAFT_293422 [Aplosporella prunicola CBS 121167]|uniref:Uncharacterized protein n=1 Tax=Aplosporella prunicola CBS 121167 TaxID=1176127 RepID=A0A6A6AT35_9PEZI|nr:uncharacterized protein K452DRAFT_293422 [Aplosporella prunicola CBS 121167]KAF2135182.1 hypothetical protein K452DRAFT_293422 [Aplosporella prunicola CBS 121167]